MITNFEIKVENEMVIIKSKELKFSYDIVSTLYEFYVPEHVKITNAKTIELSNFCLKLTKEIVKCLNLQK